MKAIIKSLRNHLTDFDFTELIFPSLCIGCSNVLHKHEDLICFLCEHQLPLTHDWLPETLDYEPFKGRVEIGKTISYMHFSKGDIMQRMMHELKYNGRKDVGIGLGILLGKKLAQHENFNYIDGLVAVPLHPAKVIRRGFNQSAVIIKGMIEHLDKPDLSRSIERTEFTPSQTTMSRFNRFRNMDKVFKCARPALIREKHLLLVDDVITTGSTLQACAKLLLDAGAASVSVTTIARA
ncbi:MAG: ComF family protein [Bacteroidia bacterium]|jgi:ComF family protein